MSYPVPPAADDAYADFIVPYAGKRESLLRRYPNSQIDFINTQYAVVYVPISEFPLFSPENYSYNALPKCYSYMDEGAAEASGVSRVQKHPYLSLTGKHTLVAILDSGIDYERPLFRYADGRSRIARLWDQTLENGNPPAGFSYGTEFTQEALNAILENASGDTMKSDNAMKPGDATKPDNAMKSGDTMESGDAGTVSGTGVVPSPDTDGHGTFLAAIAAGSPDPSAAFTGVAPDAELVVVKLKRAKTYLREYFLIPENVVVYQENDLMTAIAYALQYADVSGYPISFCCGLGTSQGAHIGSSALARMISSYATSPGVFFSISAGNEGNSRHHYGGSFDRSSAYDRVELRVPETPQDFLLELWGERSHDYWMDIESPAGEVRKIPVPVTARQELVTFIFQKTTIDVSALRMEQQSGKPLILLRFRDPAPGVWTFTVYYSGSQPAAFDMWLPCVPLLSEETYFLSPSPDRTIVSPGDTTDALTATAYDYRNDSLYLAASRGFTPDDVPKPDLAAPGVGILGPAAPRQTAVDTYAAAAVAAPSGNPNSVPAESAATTAEPALPNVSAPASAVSSAVRFTERSGTSISAAFAAGVGALLFQWAIVLDNAPLINGSSLKNYLIRSARRTRDISYPSPEWGYGLLDLYQVFEDL